MLHHIASNWDAGCDSPAMGLIDEANASKCRLTNIDAIYALLCFVNSFERAIFNFATQQYLNL